MLVQTHNYLVTGIWVQAQDHMHDVTSKSSNAKVILFSVLNSKNPNRHRF
jgi:hypothetical protein